MSDGFPDGQPDTRARRNRAIPSPEPEYGSAGSAARARVAQALLALFAGRVARVARRLLLRFERPGALFLFGFHRGLRRSSASCASAAAALRSASRASRATRISIKAAWRFAKSSSVSVLERNFSSRASRAFEAFAWRSRYSGCFLKKLISIH